MVHARDGRLLLVVMGAVVVSSLEAATPFWESEMWFWEFSSGKDRSPDSIGGGAGGGDPSDMVKEIKRF